MSSLDVPRLEIAAEILHVWLLFWTALVAIGLIIEYGPLMFWWTGKLRDKICDDTPFGQPPEWPWKWWIELIGGLLITIGVAGEFFNAIHSADVETQRRAANAAALDGEQLKRVALAKSLAPRRITIVGAGLTSPSNLDQIKHFAGMRATIEYLPEFEARRAAEDLASALTNLAGWTVTETPNDELSSPFWDGVVLSSYFPEVAGSDAERKRLVDTAKKPAEAEAALVGFLHGLAWAARTFPSDQGELTPGTVRIRIGFKPEPSIFFSGDDGSPIPAMRTERRHLSSSQRALIGDSLKELRQYRPEWLTSIRVLCPEGNGEACEFAKEIADTLHSLGWTILSDSPSVTKDFPRRLTGLEIRAHWEDQTMAGMALRRALKDANIDAADKSDVTTRYDALQLFVGW